MNSAIGHVTIASICIVLSMLPLVFAHASVEIPLPRKATRFAGAVYTMTNNLTDNSIIAYGRRSDGQLVLLGEYATGGSGAIFDDGNGVDPLISAGSVALVGRRFVLAVNAGSASVSVFKIENDMTLRLVSTTSVGGFGPVSIAISGNIVFVACVDDDGSFESFFAQQGTISGFRLLKSGRLVAIRNSTRNLENRPAHIEFSPDGRFLVVSNFFAGLTQPGTGSVDELLVFRVIERGLLSEEPVASATSTALDSTTGRSLPTPIDFQIVRMECEQYVVVAEARVFGPDGGAPVFQTGSISSWRLTSLGQLEPVSVDVMIGSSPTQGQQGSGWLQFSRSLNTFWVVNSETSTLSTFSFSDGRLSLVEEIATRGMSGVDNALSRDGMFLYQMFAGRVDVFGVGNRCGGQSLSLIQTTTDIPEMNAQGIVAF